MKQRMDYIFGAPLPNRKATASTSNDKVVQNPRRGVPRDVVLSHVQTAPDKSRAFTQRAHDQAVIKIEEREQTPNEVEQNEKPAKADADERSNDGGSMTPTQRTRRFTSPLFEPEGGWEGSPTFGRTRPTVENESSDGRERSATPMSIDESGDEASIGLDMDLGNNQAPVDESTSSRDTLPVSLGDIQARLDAQYGNAASSTTGVGQLQVVSHSQVRAVLAFMKLEVGYDCIDSITLLTHEMKEPHQNGALPEVSHGNSASASVDHTSMQQTVLDQEERGVSIPKLC